jgi:hypothetical protein
MYSPVTHILITVNCFLLIAFGIDAINTSQSHASLNISGTDTVIVCWVRLLLWTSPTLLTVSGAELLTMLSEDGFLKHLKLSLASSNESSW